MSHDRPARLSVARAVCALALLAVGVQGCGGTATRDTRAAPSAPTSSVPASAPAVAPSAVSAPPRPSFEIEAFRPAAYDGWLTEVPDGLRVDGALPEDGGDFTRSTRAVGFRFCEVEAFPSHQVLDQATAAVSGPEYGEGRDLRVFADDRAADRFMRHVLETVAACPGPQAGRATWRNDLRRSHLDGDASFSVVQSFFTYDDLPVLGATFWEVVRVGNAVLLTTSSGEYDATTGLDQGIREHAGQVAHIVEEMCVFAADGCGNEDIAAGFPLASGWPDDASTEPGPRHGLTGPNRDLPPMRFAACGARIRLDDGTDRLAARWSNVEDYRARQLTTYPTADDAVDAVAALVGLHRACPVEDGGDGYTTIIDVLRQEQGGESWAIVHRSEFHDAPAIGVGVLLVVRLGRSVLLDEAWNEGGGGPDPDADVRSQVRGQLDSTSEVVAAMCAFTVAGCATTS